MLRRYFRKKTAPFLRAPWQRRACSFSTTSVVLCPPKEKQQTQEQQKQQVDAFVRDTLRVEPDHIQRLLDVVEGRSVDLPPPPRKQSTVVVSQKKENAKTKPVSFPTKRKMSRKENVAQPIKKILGLSKKDAAAMMMPSLAAHIEAKLPLLWKQLHELATLAAPSSLPPQTSRSTLTDRLPSAPPFEHYLHQAILIAEAPLDLRERESWRDCKSVLEQNPFYVDVVLLIFTGQCTCKLLAKWQKGGDTPEADTLLVALEATLTHTLAKRSPISEAASATSTARHNVHVSSWCSEALNALLGVVFRLKRHTNNGNSPIAKMNGGPARADALLTQVAAVVSKLTSILGADSSRFSFPDNVLFHAQTVQRHIENLLRFHRSELQDLTSLDVSGSVCSVVASDVCLAHFVWLLRSIQQTLLAFEAPAEAKSGAAFRAPNTDPSSGLYQLTMHHVMSLEELWQVGTPFAQQRHAADRLLHHRTCHTMLNIKLAHYAEECAALRRLLKQQRQSEGDATPWEIVRQVDFTSTTPFWFYAPNKAQSVIHQLQHVAHLLTRTVSQADGFHTALHTHKRTTSADLARFWVPLHCIWIRTALAVELDLSMAAAHALGEQFCPPDRLDVRVEKQEDGRQAPDSHWLSPGDQRAQWEQIASENVALRVALAELTSEAFSAYVGLELAESGSSSFQDKKPPSALFLQMIRTLWFPLARRHYLSAAHRHPLPRYRPDDTRRLMEAFLSVFLLQRSASPSFEAFLAEKESAAAAAAAVTAQDEEESAASPKRFVPVCGTSLTQAMEVAFFLAYFVTYLHQATSSDVLFSRTAVDEYLKEMFYFLDLNTAKQLWHLRRQKKFFFFTGEQRHHQFTEDEELQRRLAMSALVTVHTHVVYASVLWMPLYQLQEMFFLLMQFPHLFFSSSVTLMDTTSALEAEKDEAENGESPPQWFSASEMTSSSASSSPPPPPPSQKVHGDPIPARRRVHGYLVLRLYVISNVLRTLGELVVRQQREATTTTTITTALDSTANNSLSVSIQRLLTYEPVAARQRRHNKSRLWASAQAQILYRHYNRLPAEMEGIASVSAGYVRALQRVETTVRSAIDHGLLFDVSRRYEEEHKVSAQQGGTEAKAATEVVDSAGLTSTPVEEVKDGDAALLLPASVTLRLTRPDATTQLGFVINSTTCRIRSVQVERATGAGPDRSYEVSPAAFSPFALAAHASGVADPASLVGYKIAAVNGATVHTSSDVVRLLNNALSFELELQRA